MEVAPANLSSAGTSEGARLTHPDGATDREPCDAARNVLRRSMTPLRLATIRASAGQLSRLISYLVSVPRPATSYNAERPRVMRHLERLSDPALSMGR